MRNGSRCTTIALLGMGSALVLGCGGGSSSGAGGGGGTGSGGGGTPPPAYASVSGNWLLAGSRSAGTYPVISALLVENGGQLSGAGHVSLQCSPVASYEGSFLPSATVASSGSFQSTSNESLDLGGSTVSYQVDITGQSPSSATPTSWSGSYNLSYSQTASSPFPACSYTQSASFTATPIAALTGTYSGPGPTLVPGSTSDSDAFYTLTITQGAVNTFTSGSTTFYQLPLTATLAIAGSPCFHSGSTSAALPVSVEENFLAGDQFALVFGMDDGSQLYVNGNLNDPLAAGLSVIAQVSPFATSSGSCVGSAVGSLTLTRS